jgi:hypothetical protein
VTSDGGAPSFSHGRINGRSLAVALDDVTLPTELDAKVVALDFLSVFGGRSWLGGLDVAHLLIIRWWRRCPLRSLANVKEDPPSVVESTLATLHDLKKLDSSIMA